MNLDSYRTLIFDCDGVVLDSNWVKTEAFRAAALPYGAEAADHLVRWHMANGGISRYKKFSYFLENIVPRGQPGPGFEKLLERYGMEVRKGLASCSVASGLEELRQKTQYKNWLIVSGGDQAELRSIFRQRELDGLFDSGIFGSPDTKDKILERELRNCTIRQPALFIGDSTYDFYAARGVGVDFVFVSGGTEVRDWQDFVADNALNSIEKLADLNQ